MERKSVLGKGIASLIQNSSTNVLRDMKNSIATDAGTNAKVFGAAGPQLVDINRISPCPYQPRKIFKEQELRELANSIKENGIIQPLVAVENENGKFELIAGERRLRASKLAGLDRVPVIVKRATDRQKLLMAIIENVQRSDLNCVEEALSYFQLMDSFKLTQEEVAKRVGKERSTIANFLRILKLPREVINLIQKDTLSFGHAKVLAAVKETETIIRLANESAVKNLSVRELEKLVGKKPRKAKEKQEHNPFDEKVMAYRDQLEKRTGYHFDLGISSKGAGQFIIKFNNEAEFNDIFEFLLKK